LCRGKKGTEAKKTFLRALVKAFKQLEDVRQRGKTAISIHFQTMGELTMASEWSQDLYIRAYKFAAAAHWSNNNQQLMPGTNIPYLMHFSLVAMEVIAALEKISALDGNLAVQCALLHDTMEDTDTTYAQLVQAFGQVVADGVRALTKDDSVGSDLAKQQQKERRMADSLERIKTQPKEIWIVKMADRITNLQPPPRHWTPEKVSRYREEASKIHRLLKGASRHLATRLQKKIDHYPGQTPISGTVP
jgi:(p)ppGpp synthase/HD superfamily hydrolase